MNERIKTIWEETTLTCIPRDGKYAYASSKNIQEFAELLIKECIMVVKNVQPGYRDYRSQIEEAMQDDCVEAIKQHFEIKE